MCEDCERSFEAMEKGTKHCKCAHCHGAGFVLAVQRPAGSAETGLAPWCVGCHHFILTGRQRSE